MPRPTPPQELSSNLLEAIDNLFIYLEAFIDELDQEQHGGVVLVIERLLNDVHIRAEQIATAVSRAGYDIELFHCGRTDAFTRARIAPNGHAAQHFMDLQDVIAAQKESTQ